MELKFRSELIESRSINEDSKILKFSVPEDFNFKAGQHVRMAFYQDGKKILRDYSIFSSPSEKGSISIYFKKVKGGYASSVLFDMKMGDKIEMKGPFGNFSIREDKEDIFMISSGTGFGPFRSMILDLLSKHSEKKIILVRGYRNEESLCLGNELEELAQKNKNFMYYNVLSVPLNKDFEYTGHVQDFLDKLIPSNFNGNFYICGLKEMVLSVRSNLEERGISKNKIFFERYD
ncbi:hypothetical protein COU58_00700 [Candidatus Pacearchaeota archaeon CG10_big_fil_rev_8_21_14_0_10_32_42]|nr:MAG: hypothetical protein COU58_00700 [Candidatus Pacearchaeota archaeon CG10_big_fil_rev_8_21_14_0_10_32_42]